MFSGEQAEQCTMVEAALAEGGKGIIEELIALRINACGDGKEEQACEASSECVRNLIANGTLCLLVRFLHKFDFEACKEVCKLFESLLRKRDKLTADIVEHISETPAILDELLRGYRTNAAVICGTILRACIKHKSLAVQILRTEEFWSLFEYMTNKSFDVASDAATTFKELLVNSDTKKTTAEFLRENYARFFDNYSKLLSTAEPEAYFARRQLLKLLGEVLLDRTHFDLMKRFIQSVDHLKLMMLLFKDKSDHIKVEAFNVFKIFVANPEKSQEVLQLLQKNRSKLVEYLEGFQPESQDELFREEKQLVIDELRKLPDLKP